MVVLLPLAARKFCRLSQPGGANPMPKNLAALPDKAPAFQVVHRFATLFMAAQHLFVKLTGFGHQLQQGLVLFFLADFTGGAGLCSFGTSIQA